MNNTDRYKIKVNDLVYVLYTVSVLYFANNGGISTAFLNNDYINVVMHVVYVLIPLVLIFMNKKIQNMSYVVFIFFVLMFLVTLNRSGWSLYSTIKFAGTLLLGMFMIHTNKSEEYIMKSLFVCYLVYAFFTFVEFIDRDFYISRMLPLFNDDAGILRNAFSLGYMAGLTTHTSSNGMFLSCGILMMAVGFYLTKKRSNLILLLIFITALLLTGKRGHLIFIIAALYLTYYFSLAGRKSATKLYKTLVVVVVAFITLFVIVNMIPSLSVISTRMQNALEGDDTSVIIRFELWEIAWKNFRQNPIFGIGWHQFLHTLSSAVGSNREFEVHNVYLQLLCETGVVGFLIYISWFIYALKTSIDVYTKMIRSQKFTVTALRMTGFSLAFQLFFVMYCFTGNPLYDFKMSVIYYFTCGMVFRYKYLLDKNLLTVR